MSIIGWARWLEKLVRSSSNANWGKSSHVCTHCNSTTRHLNLTFSKGKSPRSRIILFCPVCGPVIDAPFDLHIPRLKLANNCLELEATLSQRKGVALAIQWGNSLKDMRSEPWPKSNGLLVQSMRFPNHFEKGLLRIGIVYFCETWTFQTYPARIP